MTLPEIIMEVENTLFVEDCQDCMMICSGRFRKSTLAREIRELFGLWNDATLGSFFWNLHESATKARPVPRLAGVRKQHSGECQCVLE